MSLEEFREPPQEQLAYCANCDTELPRDGWEPMSETACESCGAVGKWVWRLRYAEKHPLQQRRTCNQETK